MILHKTAIPQRNDNSMIEKILGDEIILYNKSNHNIHNLNKTTALVWNLCDGEMTISEMINYLIENFKGSKEVIAHDVMQILEEMEKINLITFESHIR